ncbi:MAG: tripartite tricarboxylate transporter substrate binding protein [Burkholderiales bacterium]
MLKHRTRPAHRATLATLPHDARHAVRDRLLTVQRLALVPLAVSLLAAASAALAQAPYPARAVRWIVPSSPGGGLDIMTRTVAQKLTERLGHTFIVENRPGASGVIGQDLVAKATPDGHTLVTVASPLTILPYLMKALPYKVEDFDPITVMATVPNVLVVHPSVPVTSVIELVALARREPGRLAYGSAGEGSSPHMSVEALRALTRIELVHVPYKGTGPALVDLLGGRTQFMMANVLSVAHHVEAGKVRALGVSSTRRSAALPNVPPIGESVPGYDVVQWYGVAGPKGLPREIVSRLQTEIAAIVKLGDVKTKLDQEGAEPGGITPDAFAALIQAELQRWGEVARFAGLTPQ